MNRIIIKNEIEYVIKTLPTNKSPGPDGFAGEFFFRLDQELHGHDWSKYINNEIDEDSKFDEEFGKWLFEKEETDENDNLDHLVEYLGFKKPEDK